LAAAEDDVRAAPTTANSIQRILKEVKIRDIAVLSDF
jgi:hypothetical protein